jgi:hypothetical protein
LFVEVKSVFANIVFARLGNRVGQRGIVFHRMNTF